MKRCLPAAMAFVFCGVAGQAMAVPPSIPGLSRDGLEPRLRGLVLLGELGCTNCHTDESSQNLIGTKKAPDLASVGSRVDPEYVARFIASPGQVEPGTTMPDLLAGREEESRRVAADALTHYLVSLGSRGFAVQAADRIAAAKGRELFHSIGCVACHSPRDDGDNEVAPEGSVHLGKLDRKYSVSSLTAFLDMPLRARPSGRMPDFHLA